LHDRSDFYQGHFAYASDTLAAMQRTTLAHHPCSIARTLDVAGEWWTPLILRDVAYGLRRFSELEDDLGISANVLASRLEALVGNGLLEQRAYQQRPERHEYHLTEKGRDLLPALLALMQWGDKWAWDGEDGPVRVTHSACDHDVTVEVRCPHCEREAGLDELRARPGGRVADPPAEGDPGYLSGARLYLARGGVDLAE
jgi:DNA-binding HxlR family transcriptional regulator